MAVLLDNGSVFFRIPKTASSWVKNVLLELDIVADYECIRKHATPYQWFRRGHPYQPTGKISNGAEQPFCFTFVRRPASWLESMWRYERSHDFRRDQRGLDPDQWQRFRSKGWHPLQMLNDCLTDPFPHFVECVLQKRAGFVSEMYGWYTDPYWIDFVGKQENIVDDLHAALQQAGYDPDKERISQVEPARVSPRYETEWPKYLLNWVEVSEAVTHIRHGYDFQTLNVGDDECTD